MGSFFWGLGPLLFPFQTGQQSTPRSCLCAGARFPTARFPPPASVGHASVGQADIARGAVSVGVLRPRAGLPLALADGSSVRSPQLLEYEGEVF